MSSEQGKKWKRVKNPHDDVEVFAELPQFVKWGKEEKLFKISKDFQNRFYKSTEKSQFKGENTFIFAYEYCPDIYGDLEWEKKRLGVNAISLYSALVRCLRKSETDENMKDKKFFYCVVRRIMYLNEKGVVDVGKTTYRSHTKWEKCMSLMQKNDVKTEEIKEKEEIKDDTDEELQKYLQE